MQTFAKKTFIKLIDSGIILFRANRSKKSLQAQIKSVFFSTGGDRVQARKEAGK